MSQSQHNCSQLLSKLFLALDGELNDEEEKQFQFELTQCSWCLEHYNVESQFKHFLAAKIAKKEVAPELIAEIKARLRTSATA